MRGGSGSNSRRAQRGKTVVEILPFFLLTFYLGAAAGMLQVYQFTYMDYMCVLPNSSHPVFANLSRGDLERLLVPDKDLVNPRRFEQGHKCLRYAHRHVDHIFANQAGQPISNAQLEGYIDEMAAAPPEVESCQTDGWEFFQTEQVHNTLISDHRLVCEREHLVKTIASLSSCGQMLGSILLSFGDVVGRASIFSIAALTHFCAGVVMAYTDSFTCYVVSFSLYMGAAITLYATNCVVTCERLSRQPTQRIFCIMTMGGTFGLGVMAAGFLSRFTWNWVWTHCLTVAAFLLIVALTLPLMLSTQSRHRDTKLLAEGGGQEKSFVLKRLYRNPKFRFVSWLLVFNWTAIVVLYYSISDSNLPTWSPAWFPATLEFALYKFGLTEFFSNLLYMCVVLAWEKKNTYSLFMAISGTTCTFSQFFSPGESTSKGAIRTMVEVQKVLNTVGGVTRAGAFTALYLMTIEMLPDCHRCTLLGICSAGSRLCGIALPYLKEHVDGIFSGLTLMTCGCVAVGAGLSALMLRGIPRVDRLCRTVEECMARQLYDTTIDTDNSRNRGRRVASTHLRIPSYTLPETRHRLTLTYNIR